MSKRPAPSAATGTTKKAHTVSVMSSPERMDLDFDSAAPLSSLNALPELNDNEMQATRKRIADQLLSDAPEIEFNSAADAALSIDVEVARNAHFSDSEEENDAEEAPETASGRNKSVKIAPKMPVKRTISVSDEFAEDSESDTEGKDDDEQLQKAEQEWRKMRESLDEPGRAEALRQMIASFTPEEAQRYTVFRSSTLSHNEVQKLMSSVLGSSAKITRKMLICARGVAKVFVGQLIETAREVQSERDESENASMQPLRPVHIREALRRLKEQPNGVGLGNKRRIFKHAL